MSTQPNKSFLARLDSISLLLYFLLVAIGILSVFSVEYHQGQRLFAPGMSYTMQTVWLGISLFVGLVILFTDSKFFSSFAFLSYALGILLLLVTIVVAKDHKGSRSWLAIGPVSFQPGEVCKIFTALALAKFLSLPEVNFGTLKHRLMGVGIAMLPCLCIILQNETGLALVYFCFILVLYREGLPKEVLITGFSMAVLTVSTLLAARLPLLIVISAIAALAVFILWKQFRKDGRVRLIVIGSYLFCVLFSQVLVPIAFKHVLKGYQIERIYSLLGQPVPQEYQKKDSDADVKKHAKKDPGYNVTMSKIAIGSGGIVGKGFLNGTSTRGEFVPEQRTDFIFCSVGEQFGFLGSAGLVILYLLLMMRIVFIAERQRSTFSRVYAYCVAAILFFHFTINICMTIGLAPVIGITLPFLSYGGSSLLSFSILMFILIRLDADRGMVIR